MFDITPEDIAQLTDSDLRELIGRLCEAEVAIRGHSTAHVTWGGNQTAADGGIDVRVSLAPESPTEGFIPRASTGFQVKKQDMPRSEILREMRPNGEVRLVIQELAHEAGAYIIASSSGSTTDSALRSRRSALREALRGLAAADKLYTDFYDRTRLATWVRAHPGLVAWARRRVGRSLQGWQPYGSWSGSPEGPEGEYLWDEKLRVQLDPRQVPKPLAMVDAIDALRDELARPRKVVRLVGLSGVGKTRFVEALFDARIGLRPLPQSLALYTNLSDSPEPQPTALASDLIARQKRAVLIVDNSPADLHQRLSEICGEPASSLSVLTIEYDVREDQPDNTSVVRLETSSVDLIVKLVCRRYPQLSQVDARTIADFSGGNARIAISLAETIGPSDTIKGLTNEELFRRLFSQRHAPEKALYLAAQACSLLYSFQGEAHEGEGSEIPKLAALVGQTTLECFRHVAELRRRQLVQSRGAWRAVLPHAIANRLAASALEDIHCSVIEQQLVSGGTERLARSFSRRLSFLHDHPQALSIVESWLAPGGLLGNVSALSEAEQEMFNNVAPVSPEAALAALERADDAAMWGRHAALLTSVAYDPSLFARAAHLLAHAAIQGSDRWGAFISLFSLYLSGTHAGIEQRLTLVEGLLIAGPGKVREVGLAALQRVLDVTHFGSTRSFEFGARSRDYGYWPKRHEVVQWLAAALALLGRLAENERQLKQELRQMLAREFERLWTSVPIHDELEALARKFGREEFWPEGWIACQETLRHFQHRHHNSPDLLQRLSALEVDLRPLSLVEHVRGLMPRNPGGLTFEQWISEAKLLDTHARELGELFSVASKNVLRDVLPELLCTEGRAWHFGRGLARATPEVHSTWDLAVEDLAQIAPERRRFGLFQGFLAEIWERDQHLVHHLLDGVASQSHTAPFLPYLQAAVPLEKRGILRLKKALEDEQVPIFTLEALARGRSTEQTPVDALAQLLLPLAEKPEGFGVSLAILHRRLDQSLSEKGEIDTRVLQLGREVLQRVVFTESIGNCDYILATVAKACLGTTEGEETASVMASRLRAAIRTGKTFSLDVVWLLRALLETQPTSTLNALFEGDEAAAKAGIEAFRVLNMDPSPADVLSAEALICWCGGDHRRYMFAASIVPFARQTRSGDQLVWSEQAKALLDTAPDQKCIIEKFIERFWPNFWSGSLAEIVARNAELLESVKHLVDTEMADFLSEHRRRLEGAIAQARQSELEMDRDRNETFE